MEIKPTATIGWRHVGYGPIRRWGRNIELVDCPTPVPLADAFADGAQAWHDTGRPLESVFVDVGENGVFARDEFETVTSLGQMEFVTPEEIAELVVMELEGRPTGRDIVAALDSATLGPTYRAGLLREQAIRRLEELERQHGVRSVGFEMLGPPRLTKLLYESFIWSRLRPTVRALSESEPEQLGTDATQLLEDDAALRSQIVSVGIPVLLPDGERVYRGSTVVIPFDPTVGADASAPRGWVDLRVANVRVWVSRAQRMVQDAVAAAAEVGTGSDVDWLAIDPDQPIEPSRMARWIFKFEDFGERIKR